MQAVVEVEGRLESVGEVAAVAGIGALPPMHCLAVHVALDRRQMPNEIAEGEFARRRRPLEVRRWNLYNDSTRPLVHAIEVVEERRDAGDLHGMQITRRSVVNRTLRPDKSNSPRP